MTGRAWCVRLATVAAAAGMMVAWAGAQVSPSLYSGLRWRNIGPFHGGRVASVSGVIGRPGTFYVGLPQGGIWETTSAGITWFPVFDQVHAVDSIGAIAVAPSDPNIIYAGSGDAVEHGTREGLDGDGMYKSTDGGKTWTHIGLEGTRRIPKILVDPKNPNIVLVAALSGWNGTERGVFRSEDGGQTWTNVLAPDAVTGGRDLASPYDDPSVVFATVMDDGADAPPPGRGGFGRGAAARPEHTALYKSLDEGKTWTRVTSSPLHSGRTAVIVAMHTNGERVFEIGSEGLYRSDDQGASWKREAANDDRIRGSSYICGVWVDTQNPDLVYVMNTAAYRSTDGGATFHAFKGAPGGEDMHEVWIDPTDGQRMIYGNDQGAAVSLDGGHTWSPYYNLPAAQLYHISTDSRYPYWVLASQQDTASIMVAARGNGGNISETDWRPVASSEFGTVTADPVDPWIIYGVGYGAQGGGSGLVKINTRTGQWETAAPNYGADAGKYRASRDSWRRPDPFDPHTMYMDMQCILASHDQGHSWRPISPDLTTAKGAPQVACGTAAPEPPSEGRGFSGGAQAAVLNDFAVSTVQRGVLWTVSSNGQIYRTTDGGAHWANVSGIDTAGITLETIEASHTDVNSAYVTGVVTNERGKTDANVPLIWRTHDGGQTWTRIVNGLPSDQTSGSWVNVVRADPKQPGLLFCGTESGVYVSFNDGDAWQPLRQNLPTTSIRDMVFHTADHMNDLVIGTYGRGIWILDDMSPLREIAAHATTIAEAPAYFFQPGDAIRSRVSDNWDQPMNPELPHAPNPPYGAIFYYHLSRAASAPITVRIYDAVGHLVRTLSSVPETLPKQWPYPRYWVATTADIALSTAAGTDRFAWDLRYDNPKTFRPDLENEMDVEPGGFVTPGPHGPQVLPGVYTMKLTVDGKTYTQTVTVRNDPRVGQGPAVMTALRAKARVMQAALQAANASYAGYEEVAAVRTQLGALVKADPPAGLGAQAKALDAQLGTIAGEVPRGRFGFGRGGAKPGGMVSFVTLNGAFDGMVFTQEVGLDEAPTPAQRDTWTAYCRSYNATVAAWKRALAGPVAAFNRALTQGQQTPLTVQPSALAPAACAP